MLPSLRLAIYCGVGALLWIVAAATHSLIFIPILYDVVLLIVALVDILVSPRPHDFEIKRSVNDKMNLGAPNAITLRARFKTMEGKGRWSIPLLVRDEPPPTWPVTLPLAESLEAQDAAPKTDDTVVVPPVARLTLIVKPRYESSAEYTVTPTRRGDYRFGALSARYGTYLGLWYRQFRRQADEHVRVYPDTTEVHRYELRLRQGRLRDIGLHLTRLRGRGTEFESLRDYTTDDEYKNINWKASARQGRLISTNYEIERDQTILIALDCGRMMTALAVLREGRGGEEERGRRGEKGKGEQRDDSSAFGGSPSPALLLSPSPPPVSLSKLDCAINATVLLAHVASSMGDAVGLLLFSDTVTRFVPPRKGSRQTGAIIEALYAAQPALVEPDYAAAYEYLMARKLRRCLVMTFTDLIDPTASRELLTASGALRRHHNALCVTINNRDVIDLAEMMPESASDLYQKAMAQRMLAQRHNALEELRKHGVGILDVAAEQLTIAAVNRYLDLKSRTAL
ncbi:MAG: DUF58 domain-containing protein [Abitibacteriaceae bacterium]|nr:DUF58 domain-containing protein [Abditibacteriaceae bacterium]